MFFEEERATWYLGGGSSSGVCWAVPEVTLGDFLGFEGDLKVLGPPDFAFRAASRASPAGSEVFDGLEAFGDEDVGRCEGRTGFGAGAGGWSASVAASAAARSAWRAASLRDDGASGELLGGASWSSGQHWMHAACVS